VTYDHIAVRRDGPIGILSFDRPEVLNAFNVAAMAEITQAMTAFGSDDAVRAIVVHGNGRAFSAGFDLKAAAQRDVEDLQGVRVRMERQFRFIMQFWDNPKPTIAAVHGFCLAGAFELALACDITIAAEGTRFGEPEVRFGTGIVAMLLPWMAGPKAAKELLLTGNDRITAERALAIGVINRIVPAGTEFDSAMDVAFDIATASASSVQHTKRAVNRGYEAAGMREALLAALDIDVELNALRSPEKDEFARISKADGLKAAIAWRDGRFVRN
jgi:enoyl-CoA hydratase